MATKKKDKPKFESLKINEIAYITSLADGGVLPYGQIGNALGSIVEGIPAQEDNDLYRINKGKMVGSTALRGAGQGASIGSNPLLMGLTGGLSAPIGAAAGAITGGIIGKIKADDQQEALTDSWKENVYNENMVTSPYYALGGSLKDMYEDGGAIPNQEIVDINGPKHSEGGIEMANNAEVEGGETKVGDYIFSDTLTLSDGKTTFAKESKKIRNKYKEREGDGPAMKSQAKDLTLLMEANEQARIAKEQEEAQLQSDLEADYLEYGGSIAINDDGFLEADTELQDKIYESAKTRGFKPNEYMAKLFKCGGMMSKKKMADGGLMPDPPPENVEDPLDMEAYANQWKEWEPVTPGLPDPKSFIGNYTINVNGKGAPGVNNPNAITDIKIPYNSQEEYNAIRKGVVGIKSYEDYAKSPYYKSRFALGGPLDGVDPNVLTSLAQGYNTDLADLATFDDYMSTRNLGIGNPLESPVQPNAIINNPGTVEPVGTTSPNIVDEDPRQSQRDNIKKLFSLEGNEEEYGLLASNLPALDNTLKSLNPAVTNFNRVDPEEVDLSRQRQLTERQGTIGRNINRENIRGNATSSGQALSALASGNAAITESLIQSDLQSLMNEETTNVGIRNQADQMNTQIGNQEIIANEQNNAMAQSIGNMALADMGNNSQGYMRDKKLTRENLRQNERVMSIVNQLAPNYKIGTDPNTDEMIIKFISDMDRTTSNNKK